MSCPLRWLRPLVLICLVLVPFAAPAQATPSPSPVPLGRSSPVVRDGHRDAGAAAVLRRPSRLLTATLDLESDMEPGIVAQPEEAPTRPLNPQHAFSDFLPLVLHTASGRGSICRDPNRPCKFRNIGIHLGIRPNVQWNDTVGGGGPGVDGVDFLEKLRGEQAPGIYPAVVVAFTRDVFDVTRFDASQDPLCTIDVQNVRVAREHVFRFLADASQFRSTSGRRVQIVFRIYPSPGNFLDADPGREHLDHYLDTGDSRAGDPSYCNGADLRARSVRDMISEMSGVMRAIEEWNATHPNHEMNTDAVFFIPGNEVNVEWYRERGDLPNDDRTWDRARVEAWRAMDDYFATLYHHPARRRDHRLDGRILTPTISQWAYAEPRDRGCNRVRLDGKLDWGYRNMPQTFGSGTDDYGANDGYAWHNYWSVGSEMWNEDERSACPDVGRDPKGHHVFQFFSEEMQTRIQESGRPTFIAEADRFALRGEAKDARNGTVSRDSLRTFIQQESASGHGADYIALWHLTEDRSVPGSADAHLRCADLYNDASHPKRIRETQWHMGYEVDGTACDWFDRLWRRSR